MPIVPPGAVLPGLGPPLGIVSRVPGPGKVPVSPTGECLATPAGVAPLALSKPGGGPEFPVGFDSTPSRLCRPHFEARSEPEQLTRLGVLP